MANDEYSDKFVQKKDYDHQVDYKNKDRFKTGQETSQMFRDEELGKFGPIKDTAPDYPNAYQKVGGRARGTDTNKPIGGYPSQDFFEGKKHTNYSAGTAVRSMAEKVAPTEAPAIEGPYEEEDLG
jgi:hypothetical protein